MTYTPDTGYEGADSFTFKANDGEDDSNVATVSLTVQGGGITFDLYVDDSNTGYEDGSQAHPFNTIGEAVGASSSGDAISVAAGTYAGQIYLGSKQDLTLVGTGPGTVLSYTGYKVYMYNGQNIVIDGFSLQGGVDGACVSGCSGITFRNCVFEDISQYSYSYGGGLSAYNSSLIVENSVFENCYGGQKGGAGYFSNCSLEFYDNDVIGCRAWNSGGGPYVYNTGGQTVIFSRNYFQDCTSDYSGAIDLAGSNYAEVRIDHNIFKGCGPDYRGGGQIRLRYGSSSATAQIVNNVVADTYHACCTSRKGIYATSANAYIVNNIFRGYGYGVYASGGSVTVEHCDAYGPTHYGVTLGAGNMSLDPLFVNAANGDYHLQSGSPCIDAGHPDSQYDDDDGSRNDMGAYGGDRGGDEGSELPLAYQQKLSEYASATVRYFTSDEANNKLVSFPHAFFGTGKFQVPNGTGGWREEYWDLTRGYGAHVNMNEVTLRLLSLASAYKMDWLDYLPSGDRYAESWGQIKTCLETIRSLQSSGDPMQFVNGHFHRSYLTVIQRGSVYDLDRYTNEIVRPQHEDMQSSDDNALPFMNLLVLQGLANDPSVSIADRTAITNLCQQIRSAINLDAFVLNDRIVFNYENGWPSTGWWDRESAEGPAIAAAVLLSGQISVSEFYDLAPSMENYPVDWNTVPSGTIHVDKPSYHSAMFIHGLRAIHGLPVTDEEHTGLNFFETSIKPILEAQVDFAEYNSLKALGSQVMTQILYGEPVFERNGVQVQFPGNEDNVMPVLYSTLSEVTGPHAWFVPLARWHYISPTDIDTVFAWMADYEAAGFFHDGTDLDRHCGWEAAIPWTPTDTSEAWQASDGTWKYTDWGRPYEALNTAYTVLSVFDALNPDKPLAGYNIEAERLKHIAAYFDSGTLLPAGLFD